MRSRVHFIAKRDERQKLVIRTLGACLEFGVLLALLLLCVGFGPPVLTDGGHPPLRLAPEHIEALVRSREVPTVTAQSALLLDLASGQVLWEKAPSEPHSPASTAKLMTAVVVLDQVPLDDVVVVTPAAASQEGSRMGLVAGERLTVQELMYGLLIPSGNDAAVALAEHVAGSETDFVTMMNARAQAMGLASTSFVNAHGLDAAGQVTTASDLAAIARTALENETIAQIVALRSATVAGRELQNTNELLGTYDGADGVKTGTTDEAGECLVASVMQNGRHTLLVELGSNDRYVDARKLFDYAADAFSWREATLPDNALAWAIGSDDRPYRLRSQATSDIFVPAWQRPLLAPILNIEAGAVMTDTAPVGELIWLFGSEPVATVPLSVWQGP